MKKLLTILILSLSLFSCELDDQCSIVTDKVITKGQYFYSDSKYYLSLDHNLIQVSKNDYNSHSVNSLVCSKIEIIN
jgi:hypothetical protein